MAVDVTVHVQIVPRRPSSTELYNSAGSPTGRGSVMAGSYSDYHYKLNEHSALAPGRICVDGTAGWGFKSLGGSRVLRTRLKTHCPFV
jgi:hypothetical protein